MLTNEFTQELAALIRRLETKIKEQPELRRDTDPTFRLEQAIVALVALYFEVKRAADQ